MKPVYVVWVDSSGKQDGVWIDREELAGAEMAVHCVSVGYIVRETDTIIKLAAHFALARASMESWSEASGILTIPKVAIVSIHPLTKGKKPLCLSSTQPLDSQEKLPMPSADTSKASPTK